jgi:hypothetical protein
MPRIRSIKPDYWKSEKLAALLPGPDGREARRLFVGLWNFAEDHGVVRGNPAYIRAELYPYDEDVTTKYVATLLDMLERGAFIVRFERSGSTYIWIRSFGEHQRIDKPSKPSLPEPTDNEKRGLREHSASPLRTLPVGGGGEVEVEVEEEVEADALAGQRPASVAADEPGSGELPLANTRTTPEELQRLWNAQRTLPRWKELSKPRRQLALARIKERPALPEWAEVIRRIAASSFCRGEGGRGWKASPDWLLKPDTALRVLEGKYDDRGAGEAPIEPPAEAEPTFGDSAAGHAWRRIWEALTAGGKMHGRDELAKLVPLSVQGTRLTFVCPDRYFVEWVIEHYAEMLTHFARPFGITELQFVTSEAA